MMKKSRTNVFLREVRMVDWPSPARAYPFNLPALDKTDRLEITRPVTFFAGENGSGKSTLLEALALSSGLNPAGGSRSNQFHHAATESMLFRHLRLSWLPKVSQGFFFRAETFYNFATYLENLEADPDIKYRAYGGKSLHERSHGESFLALFSNRLNSSSPALYLLDEPEAALSPIAQMAFLRILHRLVMFGHSQFIVATHSPILLAYPDALIWDFDSCPMKPIAYTDTTAYRVTHDFLLSPERMLRHLWDEER